MAEQTERTGHHEPEPINDPPIEHDPIGQALLTLPLAVAEGAKDVAVWAVSETIIPAAEKLIEVFEGSPEATAPNIDIPTPPEETTIRSSSVAQEEMP
jgi:hypothetical protein